jgi:putative aminopeptidase FrvX
MTDLDLLQKLAGTPGLPGREDQVADLIVKNLPKKWEMTIDPIGNLVANLRGNGKRLLLIAHMDEVGLLIRRITNDGFLLIERFGGVNLTALPGSRLDLWTDRGKLAAQVGVLPQHLSNNNNNNNSYNNIIQEPNIYLDIGAHSRQDAERLGVRIGDGLTWNAPLIVLAEDIISSKALDDRLGCWALLNLAAKIGGPLDCDLFLAFIVQEETSLNSAAPVIQKINPDIVIGIDGTLVFDTPDLEGQQSDIRLGSGPALKWMDAIRGKSGTYLPSKPLASRIGELAAANKIPLQSEITTGLTTTINHLPFALQGIKTAALSLPIRYHHSPCETASLNDVKELIKLLLLLVNDREVVGC